MTPYDAAVLKDHKEVADYLRSKGGKEAENSQDEYPEDAGTSVEKENKDEPEKSSEDDTEHPPENSEKEEETDPDADADADA